MMPNRFCSGVKLTDDCEVRVSPGLSRRCTEASNFDARRSPAVARRDARLRVQARRWGLGLGGSLRHGAAATPASAAPPRLHERRGNGAPRRGFRRQMVLRRRQDRPRLIVFSRSHGLSRSFRRGQALSLRHEASQRLLVRPSRRPMLAMRTQAVRHSSTTFWSAIEYRSSPRRAGGSTRRARTSGSDAATRWSRGAGVRDDVADAAFTLAPGVEDLYRVGSASRAK